MTNDKLFYDRYGNKNSGIKEKEKPDSSQLRMRRFYDKKNFFIIIKVKIKQDNQQQQQRR